jgi:hypothetical protein
MPKDPAVRQRRNKGSTHTILAVESMVRSRAPKLPPLTRTKKVKGQLVVITEEWHPMAREFWRSVWASPMRYEYLPADEPALYRLVFMVDQFWKKGSLAIAAEIRQLEREFGLTPLSRRRLEWTVVQAEEAKNKHETHRAQSATIIDVDPRGVLES